MFSTCLSWSLTSSSQFWSHQPMCTLERKPTELQIHIIYQNPRSVRLLKRALSCIFWNAWPQFQTKHKFILPRRVNRACSHWTGHVHIELAKNWLGSVTEPLEFHPSQPGQLVCCIWSKLTKSAFPVLHSASSSAHVSSPASSSRSRKNGSIIMQIQQSKIFLHTRHCTLQISQTAEAPTDFDLLILW